jgi:hypothetical protein
MERNTHDFSQILNNKLKSLETQRLVYTETFTTAALIQDKIPNAEVLTTFIFPENKPAGSFKIKINDEALLNVEVFVHSPLESIYTVTDVYMKYFKTHSKIFNSKHEFVAAIKNAIGGN